STSTSTSTSPTTTSSTASTTPITSTTSTPTTTSSISTSNLTSTSLTTTTSTTSTSTSTSTSPTTSTSTTTPSSTSSTSITSSSTSTSTATTVGLVGADEAGPLNGTSANTINLLATTTSEATPLPTCTVFDYNGYNYVDSPNYPASYPDGVQCEQGSFSSSLSDTMVTVISFDVAAGDGLVIESAFSAPMTLSGYISPGTQFRIPGSTIKTAFLTDNSVARADRSATKKGFRLRFGKTSSGCSKFVYITSKVKIKGPRFSKRHAANQYCEYRLKAPAGKRIHIHFRTLKAPCSSNYIAFNLDPYGSTRLYREGTSKIYCGWGYRPPVFSSLSNRMNVYFQGKIPRKGFKFIAVVGA
ncbi:uncharacterized protein LOC135195351, partial [Macrobrachium nipponense]|uniref:uncharacterized protein LOC135195351 n=1 Tax=Macrobrachium nipponense TaxID=159736 RepID=UPI0030C7EAE4